MNQYEMERQRRERQREARRRVEEMTPEQRNQRIEATRPRKKSGNDRLPTGPNDPVPELRGEYDLVYPVHQLEDHINGPGKEWLFLSVVPRHLREHGWVYLKVDRGVRARARVKSIGFRTNVRHHTPNPEGIYEQVAGRATLEVGVWESVDFPADDRHMRGFRYVRTNEDEGTADHLVGGAVTSTHALR